MLDKEVFMYSSKCDIIVPIYNSLNCVIDCVQSVLKYTQPNSYRLILINDKSTEDGIEEYLNTIKNINPEIVVLNNEENLGFVKTANKGMSYSDHDVVLLNSDTIVTQGWLKKIKHAAYAAENIATVTPLTNNGSICSVPNFLEDNIIPAGFTLDEYALLIEKISLKKYPIIPTAVGFCMYIKRKIISEIGLFDDVRFGRGYGEENDFCCRLIEKGYVNVLCDDTFIFHQGSMSFKGEKESLIKNNLKILAEKHKKYFNQIESFIEKNPLKEIHDIIMLNIAIRNGKKNILYVLHNYMLPNNKGILHPSGGTEYHVQDLVQNLSNYNAYVLASTSETLILQAYIGGRIFSFNFDIGEKLEYASFHSDKYVKILENILNGCNIDLIHVHHFINHTFDIPKVAKKVGIPCVVTLHDFYSICPTINLLDVNNQYCHDTRSQKMCHQCIKKKIGYDGDFLSQWNSEMRVFLNDFDMIYAPSESAKNIIEEYYGNLNIIVNEHGIDVPQFKIYANINNEKFKIAFMGAFTPQKGSHIIEQIIAENKNKNIEWHLFGNGEIKFTKSQRKNVFLHGRYTRENIIDTLKELNIDLICNFAIWPETYSYTLTDAYLAGIPILVHDIGALGERVKKHQGGWVLPVQSTISEKLDKINEIINEKEDYELKKNNINNIHFKTKPDMAQEYQRDYEKLLKNKHKKSQLGSDAAHFMFSAFIQKEPKHGFKYHVKKILGSEVMKFFKKIIPQPLKNSIKRILYKILRNFD